MEQALINLFIAAPQTALLFWFIIQLRDGKYIPEKVHNDAKETSDARIEEITKQFMAQLEMQNRSFKEFIDEVRRNGDRGWAAAEKAEAALAQNNAVLEQLAASMNTLTAAVETRRR